VRVAVFFDAIGELEEAVARALRDAEAVLAEEGGGLAYDGEGLVETVVDRRQLWIRLLGRRL